MITTSYQSCIGREKYPPPDFAEMQQNSVDYPRRRQTSCCSAGTQKAPRCRTRFGAARPHKKNKTLQQNCCKGTSRTVPRLLVSLSLVVESVADHLQFQMKW